MHIEPNTLVSKHAFLCYSYELQHDTYAYLHDGSQSMSKFSLMKSIMRPTQIHCKGTNKRTTDLRKYFCGYNNIL